MKKFLSENWLIIALTLILFFVLSFPLLTNGANETFFINVDPDVVYITNAVLYTKYHVINYIDHPGTPSIMILYYFFIPIRLFLKYIVHQNFIQWSFDNFALLTYYIRFLHITIFSTALFIFLKIAKKLNDSIFITVFLWSAVILFVGMGTAPNIVPENLSFLLTAIWLGVFAKFIKTNKYYLVAILVFISGIAFANKFTAAFLAIAAILIPLFIKKAKLGSKIVMVEANLAIFTEAFFIGTWPIHKRFLDLFGWANSIFIHSGIHGTGKAVVFDWMIYSKSASVLINAHPITFVFICLTVIVGFILILKKKLKITDPIIFLMTMSLIGVFVFAKYPIVHYNYVNFTLIIFCAGYFLSIMKSKIANILAIIVTIILLINISGYVSAILQQTYWNEKRIGIYESIEGWSVYWAADVYREQLNALKSIKP